MTNITEIRSFFEQNNSSAKKNWGQNFLINSDLSEKIALFSLNNECGKDCAVLEIGSGLGALTERLCKIYKKVTSIEIDKDFMPILNNLLIENQNLNIVFDDFFNINLSNLICQEFYGIKNLNVCANLPYYITTPIITKIIKEASTKTDENTPIISNIILMVQREVAEKICAKIGEKNYCETSAIVNFFGKPEILFNVGRNNFYPQPNVSSSVVKISRHECCKPENIDLFFKIINTAFAYRRKTFANSLNICLNIKREKCTEIALKFAQNEQIRGEDLKIEIICEIANYLNQNSEQLLANYK